MIVDVLLIIFLIGLLVFLLSFLIHERKILKTLVFLIGSCLMLLSLGTAIYLLTALL
ncbi:NADH-quinone oxidoreductase subunit K [Streptococcus lactarius]|uniref:NADH-quinone oxidoreductase subunit K n=1 Tax=Streptococcus lactarius TaxID=684066 RepID=A0A9X0WN52_9STRE|nr:NADH-quinone oxidoreductase subunit K [Streptococcus lactarius]